MRCHLLVVDLCICAISVLFRRLSPVPMCSRLFPTLPPIRLSASGFLLRFLIHLGLSVVQCENLFIKGICTFVLFKDHYNLHIFDFEVLSFAQLYWNNPNLLWLDSWALVETDCSGCYWLNFYAGL